MNNKSKRFDKQKEIEAHVEALYQREDLNLTEDEKHVLWKLKHFYIRWSGLNLSGKNCFYDWELYLIQVSLVDKGIMFLGEYNGKPRYYFADEVPVLEEEVVVEEVEVVEEVVEVEVQEEVVVEEEVEVAPITNKAHYEVYSFETGETTKVSTLVEAGELCGVSKTTAGTWLKRKVARPPFGITAIEATPEVKLMPWEEDPENWAEFPSTAGLYRKFYVSRQGIIMNDLGREIKGTRDRHWIKTHLKLTDETTAGLYAHQVVLITWEGDRRAEGLEVLHADGDGTNNSLDNLRWGTSKENNNDEITQARRKETLESRPKKANGKIYNKRPVDQYDLAGNKIASFDSITQTAEVVGKSRKSVENNLKGRSRVCGGFIFKYADEDYSTEQKK